MTLTYDRLITDCHVAAMTEGDESYGAIEDAAILIKDGRIAWVGPRADRLRPGTRVRG